MVTAAFTLHLQLTNSHHPLHSLSNSSRRSTTAREHCLACASPSWPSHPLPIVWAPQRQPPPILLPSAYIYSLLTDVNHTDTKRRRVCIWLQPKALSRVLLYRLGALLIGKADCLIFYCYRTVSPISNGQPTACISCRPCQRAVRMSAGACWVCSGSQPGKCKHTVTTFMYFCVFLTVHLSTSLDNDQLGTHLLYFTIRLLQSSTCFEHYMFIIRRLNCTDAASGIVTLSQWPSGAQVESEPVHRKPTEWEDSRCCINTI